MVHAPSRAENPERCGLCRFWQLSAYGEAQGEESGEGGHHCDGSVSHCRRHAPPYRNDHPGAHLHGDGRWPTTRRTDWCGDFKRRDQ